MYAQCSAIFYAVSYLHYREIKKIEAVIASIFLLTHSCTHARRILLAPI